MSRVSEQNKYVEFTLLIFSSILTQWQVQEPGCWGWDLQQVSPFWGRGQMDMDVGDKADNQEM
jgi:hypothetical protein